jgi:hypothetical protein
MTLVIRTQLGYDYRDEPNDNRGCHGMTIGFVARGEAGGIPYACSLDISTHWMARPLVDGIVGSGPQQRRNAPGLDGTTHVNNPSPVVNLCCPIGAAVPDYFAAKTDSGCPWFGGSCTGSVGYLVGDAAFTVLLQHGEDALEQWLHNCARSWLEIEDATTKEASADA